MTRVRVDGAALRGLPGWIRSRVVPEALAGEIGRVLPAPADLLDLASGEVAVAVLGLDPDATVEHLARSGGDVAVMLQMVHVALAARVRDVERAREVIDAGKERLAAAGWDVAAVEGSVWGGWTFRRAGTKRRPPGHWAALWQDDVVVWVSGEGEVERFLAMAEGRALPLWQVVKDGVGEAALVDPRTALGVFAAFTRITRELADKGSPPYFLKMINDVRAITGAVQADEGGLSLSLEVAL